MKVQDLDCGPFGYEAQFSNPSSLSLQRGQTCKRCIVCYRCIGCHRCRTQKREFKVETARNRHRIILIA